MTNTFVQLINMKVVSINCDKGYLAKNGITYFNYYVTGAVKRVINNVEGNEFVRVTLMDAAVRPLIESGKIHSYKDLEGMEIDLYRKYPTYLDKFEKQNGVIKYDVVAIRK